MSSVSPSSTSQISNDIDSGTITISKALPSLGYYVEDRNVRHLHRPFSLSGNPRVRRIINKIPPSTFNVYRLKSFTRPWKANIFLEHIRAKVLYSRYLKRLGLPPILSITTKQSPQRMDLSTASLSLVAVFNLLPMPPLSIPPSNTCLNKLASHNSTAFPLAKQFMIVELAEVVANLPTSDESNTHKIDRTTSAPFSRNATERIVRKAYGNGDNIISAELAPESQQNQNTVANTKIWLIEFKDEDSRLQGESIYSERRQNARLFSSSLFAAGFERRP
ncbi:uncharacterized protein ARMOST_18733 [Armillaria ostoyae]|uniref:Uncharacterized protein n=1 Tax=Armillaria ostoyae TaxID=47428 RepID=A0A284S2M1_ARMOS|nr:uncharacterized protein ARMOST_18733 [Armillaria ostoyae]